MGGMTEMTAEDYVSVERAQQETEERGWRPGTLNEHVDGWASLVEEVEVGYSMTVDGLHQRPSGTRVAGPGPTDAHGTCSRQSVVAARPP